MTDTPLRIGIIGVAGRGGLWRHWHQPDGRSVVVAGADVNPEHLAAFHDEHGGHPFITENVDAMLARDDVDAVAVTSPDFCHEAHAIAALEAGKDVFCEKPLAITIEGCDRILTAWQRSGQRLMVGFNRNYTFIGTEGRLENSEPEMKIWVKTRRSNTERELADRTYEIKPARGGHGGADPVISKDFVDMCLDGKPPVATPLAGRMSVAAGVCAARSLRSGGVPVAVPPPPEGVR
jgi:hypothetical protein